MANKLNDVFSNKAPTFVGSLRFENPEAHKAFLAALKEVLEEGEPRNINGVSTITANLNGGGGQYPLPSAKNITQKNITQMSLALSTDTITIPLNTQRGQEDLLINRRFTKSAVILQNDENSIVRIKLEFNNESSLFTFSLEPQYHNAKTIEDVINSLDVTRCLLRELITTDALNSPDDEGDLLRNTLQSFAESKHFFERLHALEQELKITFDTATIENSETNEREIEELYLLLIEKKVIRLNAKLTATEATGITLRPGAKPPEMGSSIDLTFTQSHEYDLYGQKFPIYTANLLSNAVLKKLVKSGGTTKILYGDTDSQPMYISSSAFKTKADAIAELAAVMDHKEKYTDALTLADHLKAANKI